jgi:hypothetical protein
MTGSDSRRYWPIQTEYLQSAYTSLFMLLLCLKSSMNFVL